MKLVDRMFHRSDRMRARATLQDICDKRVQARRELARVEREADQALLDARKLEEEAFRVAFFEQRELVRSAWVPSMLKAGEQPTPFDAWAYTQAPSRGPKGKPTAKPAQSFPIKSLWIEHRTPV